MKCKSVQKNLSAFIDKEIAANSTSEIQEHLESCIECNSLFKRLKKADVLLDSPLELPADPYFVTRLKARIKLDEKPSGIKKLERFFAPAYIVAGLLFGAFLGINAGRAVMQPPQVQKNYGEFYGASDVFNSFPSGSLAAAYTHYNLFNEIN